MQCFNLTIIFESQGKETDKGGLDDPVEETRRGLQPLPGRGLVKSGCRKTSLLTEAKRDKSVCFWQSFEGVVDVADYEKRAVRLKSVAC